MSRKFDIIGGDQLLAQVQRNIQRTFLSLDRDVVTRYRDNDIIFSLPPSPGELQFKQGNDLKLSVDKIGHFNFIPGATSVGVTMGDRAVFAGVHLQTTSSRSGFVAEVQNDFLDGGTPQAHFYSIFPFADSSTSNDRTWKSFRAAHGSTLADSFWVDKYGRGYFAGELGVGTESPASTLQVEGVMASLGGSAGAPTHTFSTDLDTGMYRAADNALGLSAGGSEIVRLNSSGDLVDISTPTEDVRIVDAGSASATEQDWIEVKVGGNTGYIRVYASK